MRKLFVFGLILVAVFAAGFAAPTQAQYTGNETITYYGPGNQLPNGLYGCADFATKIPLYFSGLTPGTSYQVLTDFLAYDTGDMDPYYDNSLQVQSVAGSAEFYFYAVNFDVNIVSGYPGVDKADHQGPAVMPSLTSGAVDHSAVGIVIFDSTASQGLYRILFTDFDCETGTFSGVDVLDLMP